MVLGDPPNVHCVFSSWHMCRRTSTRCWLWLRVSNPHSKWRTWLETDSLAPNQVRKVGDLLVSHKNSAEKAMKPQWGRNTQTESTINELRATTVREFGEEGLKIVEEREWEATSSTVPDYEDTDGWEIENLEELRLATMAPQHWEEFDELTEAALDESFELEDTADSCEPMSAVQALTSAMDELDDVTVELSDEENELSPQAASVPRFICAAHELAKNLELLVEESHNVDGKWWSHAQLRLVTAESRVVNDLLMKFLVQTRMTEFSDLFESQPLLV